MRRPADGLRVAAVTVAALAAIASAAWGAVNTSIFHAHDVRVEGNHELTRDDVLALAGIGATTNVVRMSPADLERRLESSPWVAGARVGRELPDSVWISIDERSPVATVRVARRWVTLAGDATVLATGATKPSLPVIGMRIRGPVPAPGDRMPAVRTVVSVIDGLPQRVAVRTAREERDVVELGLASGARILYGSAEDRSRKNASILALLAWARGEESEVRLIDVRVPLAPALRLAPLITDG